MVATVPAGPNTIVGFNIQNAGAAALDSGVTTLAQTFRQGDLPSGQPLTAVINGQTVAVQMDVKTRYEDGSVKMAVLSVERPALSAGTSVDVTLLKGAATTGPAVDLATISTAHSVTVEMTMADGAKIHVDVMDALRNALADGTASFWQQGALATQARVEIDLPGSQRLKFDVTAFKDGEISVDAMFNNDGAMAATGGRANYSVIVKMDGKTVVNETVSQAQYQNWHTEFASDVANGSQGSGDPSAGWLNVRHDVAYLQQTGAVAEYDLSIPVNNSLLAKYGTAIAAADWGDPLAANGVTQYMPMTGGRADIGQTTMSNTAWLMSQDARAAAYSLGQAEAAGAVPWNFWDGANDGWLSLDDYPKLWSDPRGGTGRPGDAKSGTLTQAVATDTGWTPELAHQPNLSSVPYLLTGERWILDNLQAQAAAAIVGTYPANRQDGTGLVTNNGQVRAQAWSLRDIDNAAYLSPDGSPEQAYFQKISDANWNWLVSKIPEWTAKQGEAFGWVPGSSGPGEISPWQQDYFATTTIAAAVRGNEDARAFLNWQANFLLGRFLHEDIGFNLSDGVAYQLLISDSSSATSFSGNVYQTWAEIAAQMEAKGYSKGDAWSTGNSYAQYAAATVAAIYLLTGSGEARDVYKLLIDTHAVYVDATSLGKDPTFAVTIHDLFGSPAPGAEAPGSSDGGSASVTLPAAVTAHVLEGSSAADTLIGTTGDDIIRGNAGADVMTGGDGADTFILSNGDGQDRITDFVAGTDRLLFHGIDPGSLKAAAATISGSSGLLLSYGSGGDSVFLAGVKSLESGDLVFSDPPDATLPADVQAPAATAPASVASRVGAASLSFGSGADTLTLRISQDYWQGAAQYTLHVNGKQYGGVINAVALHGSGVHDTVTIRGDWGTANALTVKFLNDAWGGTPDQDRNLHVQGMSFNGQELIGMAADPFTTSVTTFAVTKPIAPKTTILGDGADTLVLKLSQDYWQGSADYTVSVNGQQIGGKLTAGALHTHGAEDTLTLRGDWGDTVNVTVKFLNDAWGGSATADRNLHVESISLNGDDMHQSASLYTTNAQSSFTFAKPAGLPSPTYAVLREGADGADMLIGGDGADILRGGKGMDVMSGGSGADTFLIAAGDGADTITDFVSGTDRVVFTGVASSSLTAVSKTIDGTSGVLITIGTDGDSLFLAGVAKLASGDLVFG